MTSSSIRPTSSRHSGPLGRYQMPWMTRMTSLGSTSLRSVPEAAPASRSSPNAPRICSRVWAKSRSRGAQGVDLVLVSRDDERVPIREVAVQGADADAGARRDVLQGHVLAFRGERLCRRGKQLFAVALRVGT